MSDQWRPEFLRSRAEQRRRFHQGRAGASDQTPPPRQEPLARASDPVRDRALVRARKLKALADRPGTVAEGAAAEAALRRYVKKHGLSMREV